MWFPALVLGLVASSGVIAQSSDDTQAEAQRIEALIRHIESLRDAKFVRNGVAYDAQTAGQFLRGKWKARESEIKTARDFIEKVATKSSTSGKLYLIRLSDGREVPSGEYLAEELRRIDDKS